MKWVRGKAGSETQKCLERLFGPVGATLSVKEVSVYVTFAGQDKAVRCWLADPDRMTGLDRESLYIHIAEQSGVTYAEATSRTLALLVDDCQEVPACPRCAMEPARDGGLCWLCRVDDFVDGLKAVEPA